MLNGRHSIDVVIVDMFYNRVTVPRTMGLVGPTGVAGIRPSTWPLPWASEISDLSFLFIDLSI